MFKSDDLLTRLPPDVALVITSIDRERDRRTNHPHYSNQGGILKLTDREYSIIREYIVGPLK